MNNFKPTKNMVCGRFEQIVTLKLRYYGFIYDYEEEQWAVKYNSIMKWKNLRK